MRISLLQKRVLAVVAVLCVAIGGGVAQAGETKEIRVRATGQVIYMGPCTGNTSLICRQAVISGQVTHIGRITGVLSEYLDSETTYIGTAVFTTPSGDTIQTEYIGGATGADASSVSFSELHILTGGTGKFEDAAGDLTVLGSADNTGAITIDGEGHLTR